MQLPNLRKWRELRGLRQVDLAELVGLSHRSVSNFESGRKVRPNHARKLAEVLDVDLLVLAGEQEPAHPKDNAPASPSHLSDNDRRTLDALDGITSTLDHRLSTDTLDAETLELARQYHDGITPTLARIMREEADALRRMHPEAHDVGPWATAGPAVARYIAVSMRVLDAGDDLDRAHEEAYRLVS